MIAHPHRLALAILAAVLLAWAGVVAGVSLAGARAPGLLAPGASLPMCGHGSPGAPFATGGETR